jgi:tripartite-type tricarboxylate transporter receptor subunit TctC
MDRCSLIRRALLAVTCSLASVFALPAHAQSAYPDKPIRLVVNFPPGGAADVIGRAVAQV